MHEVLPLPIPGSVYGLVLMLLCLLTKCIRLSQVEETGTFLIGVMPIMFVPSTTKLMNAWGQMRRMLVPLFVISVVTTIIVLVATGKVTDTLLFLAEKKKKEKEKEKTDD